MEVKETRHVHGYKWRKDCSMIRTIDVCKVQIYTFLKRTEEPDELTVKMLLKILDE